MKNSNEGMKRKEMADKLGNQAAHHAAKVGKFDLDRQLYLLVGSTHSQAG